MPVTYLCDKAKGITFSVWDGYTSAKDWSAMGEQQSRDPNWPAGKIFIADLRSGSSPDDAIRQMFDRQAASYRARIKHQARVALIASVNFETFDQFAEALRKQKFECMVFTSLETACNWLGVDQRHAEKTLRELRSSLKADAQGIGSDR